LAKATPKKASTKKVAKKAAAKPATKKAAPKSAAPKAITKKNLSRDVHRTVLENGVRVISEKVPRTTNVVFSVWADAGSRYEDLNESGATYLIQRAAMHGTEKRSERVLNKLIEGLGGEVNFKTGRDSAEYFAQCKGKKLADAADIVGDIAIHPRLDKDAIAEESALLLEELREVEGDADHALDDMFLRSLWKGHGLCRPPHGRLLTVRGQTRLEDLRPKKLVRFHGMSHHPKALIIVASGAINHSEVLEIAEKLFGALEDPKKRASTTTPPTHRFLALRNRPQFEAARFILGFPVCTAFDPLRHSAMIMNAVLAGSPDGRLMAYFKNKQSLAVDIVSTLDLYTDAGCLSIRARTDRSKATDCLDAMVAELRRLPREPLSEKELLKYRNFCKEQLAARLDTLQTRVDSLAADERYFKRTVQLADEFAGLDAVTPEGLQQLASNWITPYRLSLAVLGDLKGVNIRPNALHW
jgi:predicted Zn-dependent peptidase